MKNVFEKITVKEIGFCACSACHNRHYINIDPVVYDKTKHLNFGAEENLWRMREIGRELQDNPFIII